MSLTEEQTKSLLDTAKSRGLTREQAADVLMKANSESANTSDVEKKSFARKAFDKTMDVLNVPSSIAGGILKSGTQMNEGTYQAPKTGIKVPKILGGASGQYDVGELIAPPIVGAVRGFKEKAQTMTELPEYLGIEPESPLGIGVGFAGEVAIPDPLDAVAAFKGLRSAIKTDETIKVAPFFKSFLPDVEKEATKLGIDLPVSALTKNEFIRQSEALVQKGLFGGEVKNKIVKAFDDIATKYDEITAKFVKEQDLDTIGKVIKDDLNNFADTFQIKKRDLYDNVPKTIKTVPVNVNNTLDALENMIERKGKSFLDTGFNKQLNNLTENILNQDVITYENLNETQKVIGNMISNFADPVAVGNKAELRKLYASIASDMDEALKKTDPNAFEAIKKANQFYKESVDLLNQKAVKAITRKSPSDLFKYLSKPGKEEELGIIKKVMGEETFTEFKGSILQKIFNDSTDTKGVISSKKLANNIEKYGSTSLQKFLNPEQYQRIIGLQDELKSIDIVSSALKSGSKVAQGSQTAFLLQAMLTGGSFVANPAAAISYVLGNLGATKAFGSNIGRKALTTGFEVSKDALNAPVDLLKNLLKGGAVGGEEVLKLNNDQQSGVQTQPRISQGGLDSKTTVPTSVSALQRMIDKEKNFKQQRRVLG